MFDKSDRRFFRGSDLGQVIEPLRAALHQQHGIMLTPINATMLTGLSADTSYGLHQKVTVIFSPMPDGFQANVQMTQDLGTNGIVLAIITYLFCLPLGLLLLYLAYKECNQRQEMMMSSMWTSVHHLIVQPTFALPGFR